MHGDCGAAGAGSETKAIVTAIVLIVLSWHIRSHVRETVLYSEELISPGRQLSQAISWVTNFTWFVGML